MAATQMTGVIGGSGVYSLDALSDVQQVQIDTPFGATSSPITVGLLGGERIAFLTRHGVGHRLTPSEVPYAANLYALKQIGVTRVLSVSAVGSLRTDYAPRSLAIPDQIIDRTTNRPRSFFDRGIVAHVGVAHPFCPDFSAAVAGIARQTDLPVHMGGTYVCIEGPQFSTRAESALFRSWGASVIGMTAMPEARFAREAELCYACVAMVTDYDVWHEDPTEQVNVGAVLRNLAAMTDAVQQIVSALATLPPHECSNGCRDALQHALSTHVDAITPEARERVGLLIDRHLEAMPVRGLANGADD